MSVIQDYINSIAGACPELQEGDLFGFAQELSVLELKPKTYYKQKGELWDSIAYVAEGLLRVYCYNSQGEEVNLAFLDKGRFLAERASLGKEHPSEFYYQCIEDSVLINIPQSYIVVLRDRVPAFNRYIVEQYEQVTMSLRDRLLTHLLNDAEGRYLHFMREYPELFSRIPTTHLCSYLGIKRQHLTRIRKKLLRN